MRSAAALLVVGLGEAVGIGAGIDDSGFFDISKSNESDADDE